MLAALVLACLALACACALLHARGRRARLMLAHLPTYPCLPFIGNVHHVFGSTEHLMNVMSSLGRTVDEKQLPFVVWIGQVPAVLISDPEDVRTMSSAFVEKPFYYKFAKDWLGNGLVTGPGAIWKRSIKVVGGTFTSGVVAGFQDTFSVQAAKLTTRMRSEVGHAEFDVLNKYLSYVTLETICHTALGCSDITGSIVTTEYYEAFIRTLELIIERGMNLITHVDFIYRLTPSYREYQKCVAVLHNVSKTIITKRKKEREKTKMEGIPLESNENGMKRFKPYIDILLDMENVDPVMTEQQIRSEIDTIIVAGQETVATGLFFALVIIGKRKDVQDKLYAEVKEVLGDSTRAIEKEDQPRLQYCEAVILEALRLYPPAPVVVREADHDLVLKSCTIPKGSHCGIHMWAAGRSKRAWGPDAEEFRPERWLENGGSLGHPSSFLPFSSGKRSCIGRKYAIALMKTIVAQVVREFEITGEREELALKMDIGLKPIRGHRIQVRLRE